MSRGKWSRPNSEALEEDLHSLVQSLMRETMKLAKVPRGSDEHHKQREHVTLLWTRYNGIVAQFRTTTAKEAKRATHDALHAKLCEIARSAEREPLSTAPAIAWKRSIESVIDWLDAWAQ